MPALQAAVLKLLAIPVAELGRRARRGPRMERPTFRDAV